MCYKKEVQQKNEEKLQKKFDVENVPDFIQDYFLHIASRAARINYWITIRDMFDWLIDNEYINCNSISEIKPEDIAGITDAKIIRYLDHLKGKGIKLTTLTTKKNHLSSFWERMKMNHICEDNVVQMIKSTEYKPAKTNRMKMKKMPLQRDIQEMMDNIRHSPNQFIAIRNMIILRVLRGTGLRESELAGLDLKDVYLDEHIDERHPMPYILVISKGTYDYTDEGKDIVYLTRDASDAIEEWIEYRNTLTNIIDNDALFLNQNGKRMNERNIIWMFQEYSKGKITPHMIRHEYATVLQEETNDAVFVREQGRWRSDSMINNVYSSGAARSAKLLGNM